MSRVRAKPRLPDKRKGLRSENRLIALIEAYLVVPNSFGRSARHEETLPDNINLLNECEIKGGKMECVCFVII